MSSLLNTAETAAPINYKRRYIPLTNLPHLPFDEKSGRPSFDIILSLCDQYNALEEDIEQSLPSLERTGSFIYTGVDGIALLYLQVAEFLQGISNLSPQNSETRSVLQKFKPYTYYIERVLKIVGRDASPAPKTTKYYTFLQSELGALAVKAVALHMALQAKIVPDEDRVILNDLVNKLKAASQSVSELPKEECELLYGRAGYVYLLLFLRSRLPPEICEVTDALCRHISEIISTGTDAAQEISNSNSNQNYTASGASLGFPLHYKWHNKEYLGAAHGYLGILQTLCLAIDLFPKIEEELDAPPNMLAKILSAQMECLYQSCTFPSGNLNSSLPLGMHSDSLVHWCHGAPGAMLTSCTFLERATWPAKTKHVMETNLVQSSNTVKERGCLTKPGLCHGIGGNGIALLRARKWVMDPRLHRRATQFAFIGFKERANLKKRADRPASLYEGIGGLAVLDLALIGQHFGIRVAFSGYEL